MAKSNWRVLSVFVLAWLGFTAFMWTVLYHWSGPAVGSFFGGFALGVLPLFWMGWTVAAGLAHRGMGVDAERWTASELAKLDARMWTVMHDVPIGQGNVDHVAIGPGRVYAIETKWTSAGGRYLEKWAGQATSRALRLERLLRDCGVSREVVPLLVVWGPGVADELGEKPQMIRRARVVAGLHSSVWLERMRGAKDRLEIDYQATRAIAELIESDTVAGRSADDAAVSA